MIYKNYFVSQIAKIKIMQDYRNNLKQMISSRLVKSMMN